VLDYTRITTSSKSLDVTLELLLIAPAEANGIYGSKLSKTLAFDVQARKWGGRLVYATFYSRWDHTDRSQDGPFVISDSESTIESLMPLMTLDEVFVHFWHGTLLNPIVLLPTFVICKLKSTPQRVEVDGKKIGWLVIECMHKRAPCPV